jgi:hypothetical protein
MMREMAAVAAECITKPGRRSVWSHERGAYVCEYDPEYNNAATQQAIAPSGAQPLSPAFKLIFTTAAGGTLFFFLVCIGVHLALGKDMSDPLKLIIDKTFDLVKIGFGAVVGLLGSKALG